MNIEVTKQVIFDGQQINTIVRAENFELWEKDEVLNIINNYLDRRNNEQKDLSTLNNFEEDIKDIAIKIVTESIKEGGLIREFVKKNIKSESSVLKAPAPTPNPPVIKRNTF